MHLEFYTFVLPGSDNVASAQTLMQNGAIQSSQFSAAFRERYGFKFYNQSASADLFSRTDSNNDYYNQSFKIQTDNAASVRVIGNALQNNTWQAFTDGAYDRLQHLSVRNTDQQAISPLEFFGFRVKMPQAYYEQLSIIQAEIDKNLTDTLAAYSSYNTTWQAANATTSTADDKTIVTKNSTTVDEAMLQRLKDIDTTGHLPYDDHLEIQYAHAANAQRYFLALL